MLEEGRVRPVAQQGPLGQYGIARSLVQTPGWKALEAEQNEMLPGGGGGGGARGRERRTRPVARILTARAAVTSHYGASNNKRGRRAD